MEGQPSPDVAGTWRLRGLGAAAAVVVGGVALMLLSDLPVETRRAISGCGLVVAGVAAATSFGHRARRSLGRRRLALVLFALAAVAAALSNLLALVGVAGPASTVSLMLCLALGLWGLACFPKARRRGTDLTRMVLDGIVIGGSVLFILSVTLFPTILDTRSRYGALVLVVPIADVAIATLATLLFLRGARADRPLLGLAAIGFVAFAVSDLSYAAAVGARGDFSYGSVVDIGWIAGYAVIALAAQVPDHPQSGPDRPVEASPVLSTGVIFTLFLVAAGLSLFGLRRGTLATPSTVLWCVVLLAVLARQILLIVDNERLRRILEQRVLERSRSLQRATQQTDLLVNSVGDGIYGVDARGLVTFVNPAAARALGYPASVLIGRAAHDTFHADGPTGTPYPVDGCYVVEAIRDRVVTSAEGDVYVRADGSTFAVEVTATPLAEAGAVTGAVVVFRDVTQRREVDRLKSEFVSMVSHELRTPLTAIRGSLGLISGGAMGPLSPAAGRMVDIALISSERLTRMINEILDIERIEAGVMAMDPRRHAVSALVDSAVGQVQVLAEDASITVEVLETVGEVHADADRVVQTLLNLLGNAIKFSTAGSTVTVTARPYGAFVEFTIADRGRGIPEDKLDSIFDRFEQVDSSDARDKGGSGLGLAISRSLIERLGGRIWAVNNADGGATFRFTLPVAEATDPPITT